MKIFSGNGNILLAEKIAASLGLKLSEIEIHIFPDGEKRVRIIQNVVGENCVVVQPTSPPADQNYMELFFIVDALKRSTAAKITVVMPYVGYQRQDHVFRSGEAVSLDVVIKTLEANGVNAFLAFDFHSIKTAELFKIPVTHLSALPLFADIIKKDQLQGTVLVSPDMGGKRRVMQLSQMLDNMPFVAIEKNRDLQTGAVEATIIHGQLEGKKQAIIIDDMISSGKTIVTAANLLLKKGVEQVFVFATHPVFSNDASSILQNAPVEKVYVTDTVFVPKEKLFPKLEILSVAPLIAEKL